MSSRFRRRSRSAGFSLVEVLVALAIAAMMTVMLVRFVGGTRVSAARISEALEMATMAETLLARVASGQDVHPGRTVGRAGAFLWRIEIQPITFTATARRTHERAARESAETGAEKATTRSAGKAMKADAESSGRAGAALNNWITYRVAVAVEAPSGRKHVADTVRVGAPPLAAQR
jgi:prepilin-type N-terminal cleavage/methylation domain-containing protein